MIPDAKILFVDDEPNVLLGFQRQLRKKFNLDIADSAANALRACEEAGPYAVLITDMRMPTMDGIELLQRVRQRYPDTVRLMLTGNVDIQTAINAVNDGCVFRFLTKPCPPEIMGIAITAALEQHALVTAERDLLSKTLAGSVELLTDILSISNPAAFGCTSKIRRLCSDICAHLQVADAWEVTTAATLALVGCIAIPEQILMRVNNGEKLDREERALFDSHPQIGSRLISRIPKLEQVAQIVQRQNEPYSITMTREGDDRIGFAANILKAAIDFGMLVSHGASNSDALSSLASEPNRYRPTIVDAMFKCIPTSQVVRNVMIADILDGMVLDEHLVTLKGELLLARGNTVSTILKERLRSLAITRGVKEPVRVLCQP